MRRAVWILGLLAGLSAVGGCEEPEPQGPLEMARERWHTQRRAEEGARTQQEALEAGKLGIQRSNPRAISRALLERYGSRLRPFQRSKLLGSSFATYAEGEAAVQKWIEENQRFDRGGGQ